MNTKPLILICDDDTEILQTLQLSLKASYKVMISNTVAKAKNLAEQYNFAAAVIDLNFEGQEYDGIHLIDFMGRKSPGTYLVVLSGDNTVKRVVEAMRRRLFEFIEKDINYFDALLSTLNRATQIRNATTSAAKNTFLTTSPAVKEILRMAEVIVQSSSESPILIQGETGSGKEFLAQHIAKSLNVPIVATNMGCVPKDTAESILFGHEQGAFTGAVTKKIGLIESANGGLFFLDEIGECSASVQTKLLRVIQEKEVWPLGSSKATKISARFIAATHKDLDTLVEKGEFRLDLLQRLNTFILRLPPLRERPEDIIFYANIFLKEFSSERHAFSLTYDGKEALLSHSWPGNVRELKNVIERIIVFSYKFKIDKETVLEAINLGETSQKTYTGTIEIIGDNVRRDELIKALQLNRGRKRQAASSLGVSEATLYRWLKEFDLENIFKLTKCEMPL